jgi:hypothetical protein
VFLVTYGLIALVTGQSAGAWESVLKFEILVSSDDQWDGDRDWNLAQLLIHSICSCVVKMVPRLTPSVLINAGQVVAARLPGALFGSPVKSDILAAIQRGNGCASPKD